MLRKILVFTVSLVIVLLLARLPIFPLVSEAREFSQTGESLYQTWDFVSMPEFYDADSRGKGYVTEALTMFVKYLFSTLRFNRLKISILPGNAASRRVAEKCGFKHEGIARGAFFHMGRHHDVDEFSLLRSEFERTQ